ncbi:MAG TPA: hypothetical protein VJM50_24050 [Pyrinomonadaceae bacterium]|nr:hypothetical protein [Pyrinomonadaceae bacterium]
MPRKPEPPSPADRVRASEARKIANGGRRLPGGILSPDAAAALDGLLARGYAASATACIAKALIAAAKRRST